MSNLPEGMRIALKGLSEGRADASEEATACFHHKEFYLVVLGFRGATACRDHQPSGPAAWAGRHMGRPYLQVKRALFLCNV